MGLNYLSIPKLQRCNRWSLGMDKLFQATLYQACNYLSMLGLKLNHVSKRGHRWPTTNATNAHGVKRRTFLSVYYVDSIYYRMLVGNYKLINKNSRRMHNLQFDVSTQRSSAWKYPAMDMLRSFIYLINHSHTHRLFIVSAATTTNSWINFDLDQSDVTIIGTDVFPKWHVVSLGHNDLNCCEYDFSETSSCEHFESMIWNAVWILELRYKQLQWNDIW